MIIIPQKVLKVNIKRKEAHDVPLFCFLFLVVLLDHSPHFIKRLQGGGENQLRAKR